MDEAFENSGDVVAIEVRVISSRCEVEALRQTLFFGYSDNLLPDLIDGIGYQDCFVAMGEGENVVATVAGVNDVFDR